MKLGNIIYSGELINHEAVSYINYYNVDDGMGVKLGKLPTLIVGYSLFKNLFSEKFPDQSILDKIIIPNKFFWEFSFSENKKQNIEGVELFVNESLIKSYFFDFRYINIDPIFDSFKNEEELLNKFNSVDCVYVDQRMLYVVSSNCVFGLDMDVFDFYGFNINFIKNNLLEKAIKRVIDIDNNIYLSYYKMFPELDFLKRYIPLFELIK